MASKKGESRVIKDGELQRCQKSRMFFKSYVKEHANLVLYEDSSVVLEFKIDKDGRVKYRYEMESCVGVYLRVEFNEARANWPDDIHDECCFTLVNQLEDKNLYLIAETSKVALQWIWKLSQYVKVPESVKKTITEEFSIRNLIDVYNVLITKPSLLLSNPASWKLLGKKLGLADKTLKKIEEFRDAEEDRLYDCLSKWIKRYDEVDDKGGATCSNLADSLTEMGYEEIAERVFKKFNNSPLNGAKKKKESLMKKDAEEEPVKEPQSQSSGDKQFTLELDNAIKLRNRRSVASFKDQEKAIKKGQNEDQKRKRALTLADQSDKKHDKDKALAIISQKDTILGMVWGAITYKMRDTKNNVISEIARFSDTTISSLVTINNETPHAMTYHQCFVARGRISDRDAINQSTIPGNSQKSYSFEKYSSLSLDGCAAIIVLSVTTCESTKCYFAVAFRNYIRFTKSFSKNKAALLILNDATSIATLLNSQFFGEIMRNKDDSPNFAGCYKGDIYSPSFMLASLDSSQNHNFRNLCFRFAMIDDPHRSRVNLTVQHPELLG
ncbi:PREDICTED: uncharacterized protein LOC109581762 [Amphimedon queenslandica]|uniref:Death domain-containing protein n=1 Tax=Amphimedon queenslandica TaxID=400682 RepID=A0A1X7UX43_AMPQE|nr:PREDICTED: uncharacterized protein LOC109581762 [Amphimedon queenslandica]|eukprot:XP_019851720.1 PREDICTED: uncharacterized protein LOC109581762 [Amphimedon queenslandica]